MEMCMIFQLVTILFINITTARKTIFSFSKCSEKMVFPKKLCWNMIPLVLSGKMIFLFPENIILFFKPKMKDDLSQKNTWKCNSFFRCSEKITFLFPENMILFFRWKMKMIFLKKYMEIWYFLQMPQKDCLSKKKITLEYDLSYIIWKIYFFFGRKMEDDLSQEIHGNIIFSVYMYKCYKYNILQKKYT